MDGDPIDKPKKRKYVPKPPEATRFKPGQTGNAGGKPKHAALVALREITIEEYRKVIELVMTSDLAALQDFIRSQTASAIQVGVARAFYKAVNSGDWDIIERIAARIVGKLPDELKINSTNITTHKIEHSRIVEANKQLENDF